jgi:hypothetical protein
MTEEQDNGLDTLLMEAWQCGVTNEGSEQIDMKRQIERWAQAFDRRIFWRNLIEYGAGVVVLVRSGLEFASGERHWTIPLTSVVITFFILGYVWQKHRRARPVDPDANAGEYRAALLARIDDQIALTASARYWYVLPVWIFFVIVFITGALRTPNATRILQFGVEFLLATAFAVLIVWLNERYGMRGLQKARQRVESLNTEALNQ